MYQLVYTSISSNVFKDSPRNEIEDILNKSIENNQKRGVTGILLFQGAEFVQILEGEKDDVLSLYGRICTDERHSSARILLSREVSSRTFPYWNMAYIDTNDMISKDKSFIEIWNKITGQNRVKDNDSAEDTIKLIMKIKEEHFNN